MITLVELQLPIFRHLKLELLTQFPASNDVKYSYLYEIHHPSIIQLLEITSQTSVSLKQNKNIALVETVNLWSK